MNTAGNKTPWTPGRLTGFALVKIRRLVANGWTIERVAAYMRISVADVEQVIG